MSTTLSTPDCVVPEQRGGVASALLEQVTGMGDDELTVRARELAGEISAAEASLAAVLAEVERRGHPFAVGVPFHRAVRGVAPPAVPQPSPRPRRRRSLDE